MSTIITPLSSKSKALREVLEQSVLQGAHALLGCHLVAPGVLSQIVETEAYRTPDDPGCHAHRGMTPRNRPMFGPPGHAYLYFTYGNHWMLNVVAHPEGVAAAVLIRAALPLAGHEVFRERRPKAKRDHDLLSGPGKLAAAYGLNSSLSGMDLFDPQSPVHIIPGEDPPPCPLIGSRIGLRAGAGDDIPWRFCDPRYLPWVSQPATHRNLVLHSPMDSAMIGA